MSVELAQQLDRGEPGVRLNVTYQYEAYASFHFIQLHTEGAPILLFSDPMAIPQCSPWDLCVAGDLGSMESNVMAGRALLGCLQLPDGQRRCAIFLVHEKVMQGSSKSAEYRAYRRIAPKSLELVLVSQPVAQTFCSRLLLQHLANAAYFDPGTDWPKPIELNAESLRPNASLLRPEGLLRQRCPCDIPTSANGCLESGLHSWTKVSNMATTREAPTPSPKIISISGTKNEPKTNPLYLLVLVMTIFPFLFC